MNAIQFATGTLAQFSPCLAGLEWAKKHTGSLQSAWDTMPDGYLIWVATRPRILPLSEVVEFAIFCAESVVHLTSDPDVAACIAVTRRYAAGEAGPDEILAAQRGAVYAAALSAARAAALAAARAAIQADLSSTYAAAAAAAYSAAAAADASDCAVAAAADDDARFARAAAAADVAAAAAAAYAAAVAARAAARAIQAAWLRANTHPFALVAE